MASTPLALATKDNASGQLASGISAAATSIPLQSGEGANFPQPYTGACTSGGSSTALNDTGISAQIGGSAMEGKWIWNLTDGSMARIKTVNTNDLVTTRLIGGSDNTWSNSDEWVIDPFILTLEKVSTNAYGVQSTTQYEEVLIIARSTDTLTAETRGYNGTVANTFDTDDFAYLHVTSPIVERLIDLVGEITEVADGNVTDIATHNTTHTAAIDDLEDGSAHYAAATGSSNAFVVTLSPVPGSLTAGLRFTFKANHTIDGAATINPNSLGATAIKKEDGATALASGDIQSGQIVEVEYDGTNFQMLSPIGQTIAEVQNIQPLINVITSEERGVSTTSEEEFDDAGFQKAITGGTFAAGDKIHFTIRGFLECGGISSTGQIRLKLGSTAIFDTTISGPSGSSGNSQIIIQGEVTITDADATGATQCAAMVQVASSSFVTQKALVTTVATNIDFTGSLTLKASIQSSSNEPTSGFTIFVFNAERILAAA